MEELKRFQGSTSDAFSRDTILELIVKIQELQNEVNCINDSRDFNDAASIRIGLSHVPSQPAFFPPHSVLDGMLSRSVGITSRNHRAPDIWDTHDISGNVFVNPTTSSSALYPGGFNLWISIVMEHIPPHVTSERQTRNTTLIPRCQSGPSVKNSVIFGGGRLFKEFLVQTNNDYRFQIFIWKNSPHQPRLLCWKIKFKIEVCTCSQFHTETLLWIKEMEMVDSCEDCFSTEQNQSGGTKSTKKGSFFFRGKQIAYLIHVLPGHWSQ